jgi:predicted nucleic acid-binding protein
LVLPDEPKARLAASVLGLRFIGTIGILLSAKRLGKLETIRPFLDELKRRKFYLSETVYQAALTAAEEA